MNEGTVPIFELNVEKELDVYHGFYNENCNFWILEGFMFMHVDEGCKHGH